ncbi:unnamed protein product [Ophioblennius macclurei]
MPTLPSGSTLPDWAPEGPERRSPIDAAAVEAFAQNMSESIVESLASRNEADFYRDCEALGERLASAVIECAVMEACGAQERLLASDPGSAGPWEPLSQVGLLAAGSLDYPDAPPTTPLVPELLKSRSSFPQKLKGGLAKVFQPSPPPPTPKDVEEEDAGMDGRRAELVELLMDSLSEVPRRFSGVEDFAEALSSDIMDCVLGERMADDGGGGGLLELRAQKMAESIIASSLDAVYI